MEKCYNLVLFISAEKVNSNIKPFRPVQPTVPLFFFPSLPCFVSRSLLETENKFASMLLLKKRFVVERALHKEGQSKEKSVFKALITT